MKVFVRFLAGITKITVKQEVLASRQGRSSIDRLNFAGERKS